MSLEHVAMSDANGLGKKKKREKRNSEMLPGL